MIDNFENKMREHSESLKKAMRISGNTILKVKNMEDKTMAKGIRKRAFIKRMGYGVAGVAVGLVLCVNCIPDLAYASMDIPVLGELVRVLTFNRYEIKESGRELFAATPKIEGLLNKEIEDKLNNEFKENADIVILAFEEDIKKLEKEFGNDFHLGVEMSYVVRTDNEDILAIDTYIVNTVGSSSTKHAFYNINKKTRELLELKALFKDNTDYITPISEYIISEMKKANESGAGEFWIGGQDGFVEIKDNQNFFINDSGNIVICFDKYEVAIGAKGCPEFEIPQEIVKDILKA